jgi:hypothetical protein
MQMAQRQVFTNSIPMQRLIVGHLTSILVAIFSYSCFAESVNILSNELNGRRITNRSRFPLELAKDLHLESATSTLEADPVAHKGYHIDIKE